MKDLSQLGFQQVRDIERYIRILFFGGPFTGKTTAMLTMPNALFIGAERGIGALARTHPKHKQTGKNLEHIHSPLGVQEFDDAKEAYNTIMTLDRDGYFANP